MDALAKEAIRTKATTPARVAVRARIALAHTSPVTDFAALDMHEQLWRSLTDDAAELA